MITIALRNKHQFRIPKLKVLQKCCDLVAEYQSLERIIISIEIASVSEIQQLNRIYRKEDKPTNILSFPFSQPIGIPDKTLLDYFLGDIVICPEILKNEAIIQYKDIQDHWCHLLIHGILHLLGYNHNCNNTATKMEQTEVVLLKRMSIKNPYLDSKQ